MKIALIGSSGYIAGFLLKRFAEDPMIDCVLTVDQNKEADIYLNLIEPEKFNYSVLNGIDFVIFTAAISSPDRCASEYEQCWKINVNGTSYFIREAIRRNCRVLFFSSDAVFGDIPGEIYTEESETNASTPYGRMKKAVEDEFKTETFFKAIRLSYVVSAQDRFVSYCLQCIEKGEIADIFHPFYRNCITVSDVVNVVIWFVNHWSSYHCFAFNVAGKELVSRVRIADELIWQMGYKLNYSISTPDEKFYQNRPKITQMKSLYLQEYGILEENTFTEKLKKELEDSMDKKFFDKEYFNNGEG